MLPVLFCFQSRAARPGSAPLLTPRRMQTPCRDGARGKGVSGQRPVCFVPQHRASPALFCCLPSVGRDQRQNWVGQTLCRRERVVRAEGGGYFSAGSDQPVLASRLWAQQRPVPPSLGSDRAPADLRAAGVRPPPRRATPVTHRHPPPCEPLTCARAVSQQGSACAAAPEFGGRG